MSRSLNIPKPTESREVSPTKDHYYISGLSGLDRGDAAPRSIINHLWRSWSSFADHGLQWNRHWWSELSIGDQSYICFKINAVMLFKIALKYVNNTDRTIVRFEK